jgi:hypothetical protein
LICLTKDDGTNHWSMAFTGTSVMFCGQSGHVRQVSLTWKPSMWRFGTRKTVNHDANRITTGFLLGPLVFAHRRPLLGL